MGLVALGLLRKWSDAEGLGVHTLRLQFLQGEVQTRLIISFDVCLSVITRLLGVHLAEIVSLLGAVTILCLKA